MIKEFYDEGVRVAQTIEKNLVNEELIEELKESLERITEELNDHEENEQKFMSQVSPNIIWLIFIRKF